MVDLLEDLTVGLLGGRTVDLTVDRMEVLTEKHLGIQQTQALTEGLTVDLLVARMEDPTEEQRIQQQQTERACLMEEEGALMLWPSRLELVLPLRVLQEPSPR